MVSYSQNKLTGISKCFLAITYLKHSGGPSNCHYASPPHLFGMVVYHARGVIDSQANLILPFTGLGPSKPNLVFPKLTGNVWNDLPHVQSLPSSIISSVKFNQTGARLRIKSQ